MLCPICEREYKEGELIGHLVENYPAAQLASYLITRDTQQRTQATTISAMQEDARNQANHITMISHNVTAAQTQTQAAAAKVKRLEVEAATANQARAIAETELQTVKTYNDQVVADYLARGTQITELQAALEAAQRDMRETVKRLAVERDQALDQWGNEVADLRNQLDAAQEAARTAQQTQANMLSDLRCPMCPARYVTTDALGSHVGEEHSMEQLVEGLVKTVVMADTYGARVTALHRLVDELRRELASMQSAYHERGKEYQAATEALDKANDRAKTAEYWRQVEHDRVAECHNTIRALQGEIKMLQEYSAKRGTAAAASLAADEATRYQLSQVLESVAGARLAINKALAIGQDDPAHFAALNNHSLSGTLAAAVEQGLRQGLQQGLDASAAAVQAATRREVDTGAPWVRALHNLSMHDHNFEIAPGGFPASDDQPVGWIVQPPDDHATVAGIWGGVRYLVEMHPATLYPPAGSHPSTINPSSLATCPACKNDELKFMLHPNEHGYLYCAECQQEIANVRPVAGATADEGLPLVAPVPSAYPLGVGFLLQGRRVVCPKCQHPAIAQITSTDVMDQGPISLVCHHCDLLLRVLYTAPPRSDWPTIPAGWEIDPTGQLVTRATNVERTVQCPECRGEMLKVTIPLDTTQPPTIFCATCRQVVAVLRNPVEPAPSNGIAALVEQLAQQAPPQRRPVLPLADNVFAGWDTSLQRKPKKGSKKRKA